MIQDLPPEPTQEQIGKTIKDVLALMKMDKSKYIDAGLTATGIEVNQKELYEVMKNHADSIFDRYEEGFARLTIRIKKSKIHHKSNSINGKRLAMKLNKQRTLLYA